MTTAAPADLLAAYDSQLRGEAEVWGAPVWDRSGPLWRAVYDERGFVTYEDLAGADVAALVSATVRHYADSTAVASFEWKTRGHDDVPGLHEALHAAGFEAEEVETVMVGEAAALAVDVPLPPGVIVRRIDDQPDRAALLAATSALQREVFGRGGDDLLARVERSGGDMEVWVAQAGGAIVSAGRLEAVPGTEFGGLWGGCTRESWRGQGVYRALTAARARSAVARGLRLVNSDCTAMSRPILERSGLVAVTTTTPYVWTRG